MNLAHLIPSFETNEGQLARARELLEEVTLLLRGTGAPEAHATEALRSVLAALGQEGATGQEARPVTKSDVAPRPASGFSIGPRARWFTVPSGEKVVLDRHRVLQLVLHALALHRIAHPDEPISRDALIQHVWPDEAPNSPSGTARLNVALFRLRRMGLRPVLLTMGNGYALDSSVAVEISAASRLGI